MSGAKGRGKIMSEKANLSFLHEALYRLLLNFDALCKENDIEYWIDAGTLLGAVRHGGFIPWDDDVDVCMTRENYQKFMSLKEADLPENCYLIRPYEGYYSWGKFCDRTIELRETWGAASHLFLDIFPFEKYRTRYPLARFRWFLAALVRRKAFLRAAGAKSSLKRKMLLLAPIDIIESWIGIRPAVAGDKRSGYRVGKECMYFENRIIPEGVIFPLATIEFRDAIFPCPRDTHYYLTAFYGDYMRIPEDRSGHFEATGGEVDVG
jgi:lipopolysaccharide cholinephosphotransferase